uniref:Uncharacterized protein n=1 Tax=Timema bartmani TaxID=61472 RepID=A0A7R9I7A7_9NEOP|nr:unnamed protein product [Timema bartmani]
MTNEVEDNENDSQEDDETVDTEAATSVTLNIQIKGELTPEQQKLLIDIRRRKTELLLEIQWLKVYLPPWSVVEGVVPTSSPWSVAKVLYLPPRSVVEGVVSTSSVSG